MSLSTPVSRTVVTAVMAVGLAALLTCAAPAHAALLLAPASTPLSAPTTPAATADSTLALTLQGILDRAVTRGRLPGASVLLARAGEVLFRGAAGNLDPDDPVEIASSTKPIVATLLAALADDGILDLDTPISAWLPEWSEVPLRTFPAPRAEALFGRSPTAPRAPTVRELLTHTSGIAPLYPGGRPTTGTLADFSELAAGRGLVAIPGVRFAYGGPSYDIAARLAEVAAGVPFERLLRERLFAPLGMEATRFEEGGRLAPARATPPAPAPAPPDAPSNRWVSAGGGLTSTLDDLHRFWSLHLTGGLQAGRSVLSEEALAAIRTPLAQNPRGTPFGSDYGLGVYLDRSTPEGSLAIASHGGAFGTLPWVDLDRGVVVIVFVPGNLARANPIIRQVREAVEAAIPVVRPPATPMDSLLAGVHRHLDAGWGAPSAAERRERFLQGEGLAREARALDPDDPEARWWLLAALGLRGQEEPLRGRIPIAREVHREAEALVRDHPDHPGGHHALGRLHGSVLRLGPPVRWFYSRIVGDEGLRDASWERAEWHLRRATALEPAAPHHRVELARVLRDTGRPDEARSEARRALSLPDEAPLAAWYRGWAREILEELAHTD